MIHPILYTIFFFFNDTATTEIYTLSLHDALPISPVAYDTIADIGLIARNTRGKENGLRPNYENLREQERSEEHTSELQSRLHLVCRLLLEKKKNNKKGP